MLEFKKYSSIENDYNKDFVDRAMAEMPPDLEFVVQEKVHGANVSFLCNGNDIQFAKRTSILAEDEQFYNYEGLFEAYKDRVMSLFANIKERYPNVKSISVFGEMFGGYYPHEDVQRVRGLALIQRGVYYSPTHEFYGFDIFIFNDVDGNYLSVSETNELFEKNGFFYAKTLFQGSLAECLKYSNRFESHIPQWLGLPAIEDNICEGIVIRPVTPMFFRNGSRVLIKSKNERFAEKKGRTMRDNILIEQPEYSPELIALMDEVACFITENRLINVVSHIGEISIPKDMGKVMGLFSKDARIDFLKEHGKAYSDLEKSEQKLLNKEFNRLATEMIQEVYMKP